MESVNLFSDKFQGDFESPLCDQTNIYIYNYIIYDPKPMSSLLWRKIVRGLQKYLWQQKPWTFYGSFRSWDDVFIFQSVRGPGPQWWPGDIPPEIRPAFWSSSRRRSLPVSTWKFEEDIETVSGWTSSSGVEVSKHWKFHWHGHIYGRFPLLWKSKCKYIMDSLGLNRHDLIWH